MWNRYKKIAKNTSAITSICYSLSNEDLGNKKISRKQKHRKAYEKIFREKALINMKERLDTFQKLKSQIKLQNDEANKDSEGSK